MEMQEITALRSLENKSRQKVYEDEGDHCIKKFGPSQR